MMVLQVVNDFFPEVGGVQRYVLDLSRALSGKGIKVRVVTSTRQAVRQGQIEGVPVTYVGHLFRVSHTYISPRLPATLTAMPADVIHAHFPCPWSMEWALLLGRLRRVPTVLTYHNDPGSKPGLLGAAARAYERMLLPLVIRWPQLVVTSTPDRHALSRALQLGRRSAPPAVLPPGVDDERLRPLRPLPWPPVIGFLALLRRTHLYKGLDVLLTAMAIARRRGERLLLQVGGDGDLRAYYERLAARLGLQESVRFLGYVPEEELCRFYNSCTLFVLPSTGAAQEGFGLVALEAMACGRPVVTTTAAGVAWLVHERGGGVVTPAGDPEALAETLLALAADRGTVEAMGKRAREVAEGCSWRTVAERYLELYQALVPAREAGNR